MHHYSIQKAFSLFELIITISVLAIIACIALPSFHNFREQQEVSKIFPTLRQNIQLAKTLAASFHNQIVICSSNDAKNCLNDQWAQSLIIFSDLNRNKQLDQNEPVHQRSTFDLRYGQLRWKGGTTNLNTLTFQRDNGLPRGSAGAFYYCSFDHPDHDLYIAMNNMGNTRVEKTNSC